VSGDEVATGRFDLAQTPSTAAANLFNEATIRNTRQWIFHHPDDTHLVPEDLPEPKNKEMEVIGGPAEFSGRPLFGSPSAE
jgi:hypothetical protein